ncbi:hypothetical protein NQ317_015956 [Molorchus minor]|uniref:Uncharacterized protein n=1 Tax=Molorchus minor TaxID=1323400 RepID=A0ABQ9JKG2_9CUCU|nr:hypothetical protein NQ317_015956 [Molorchus minor]
MTKPVVEGVAYKEYVETLIKTAEMMRILA